MYLCELVPVLPAAFLPPAGAMEAGSSGTAARPGRPVPPSSLPLSARVPWEAGTGTGCTSINGERLSAQEHTKNHMDRVDFIAFGALSIESKRNTVVFLVGVVLMQSTVSCKDWLKQTMFVLVTG